MYSICLPVPFSKGIGNATHVTSQPASLTPAVEEPTLAVTRDRNVTLICRVEGSPELLYEWFHNGVKVTVINLRTKLLSTTASFFHSLPSLACHVVKSILKNNFGRKSCFNGSVWIIKKRLKWNLIDLETISKFVDAITNNNFGWK